MVTPFTLHYNLYLEYLPLILFLSEQNRQQLYVFKHERCDVKYYRDYTYNGTYTCYKLNRNELYLNLSLYLNVTLENDKEGDILVTGYQFRSNEYRKGPIEFRMGLCSASNRKDFGIPKMMENGNIKCPLCEHQKLYLNKLTPNASNFPPLLPEGRWKLQLDFFYKKIFVIGYQFRSNEYSKGPVEFRMGLCSAANRKDFDIPKMIENSNFKCPLREHQKIYTNKLTPNASNFPPLLPEGRWKLQLDFSYKKVIVMTINWYASVEYPIKWPSN
ncbi:hypothetical protein FQR65_LT02332 [Abscondita terminalis]|nr:hypothetical protein FQR65_LT02332 [Abscondita terminalis]